MQKSNWDKIGPKLLHALKGIHDQACINGCPEFEDVDGDITVKHTRACSEVVLVLAEIKSLGL